MAEKESNFTGWLNEKILPLVGKFANTRFVRAVMGAGYSIIAFTIVGSMFLILSVLTQVITFPSFVDFYNSTLGRFNSLFTVIYNSTKEQRKLNAKIPKKLRISILENLGFFL